ncbi:MAG: SDR family oxidoreductase [Candidatus Adlerbacteria bacterium]|nr:SDR family oxidoreductase [Candidatus Adlerbacteria bacterium]
MQKVCLVTGGSRGIGAATALLLAGKGYNICVNYRTNKTKAQVLVEKIRNKGVKAIAAKADVSDPRQVDRLFRTIDDNLGRLTALVNNAGVAGSRKKFLEVSDADFDAVLDVNFKGTVHCTRHALQRMALSRGGSGGAIVNISSTVTTTGGIDLVAYVASKGAVEAFSLAVAKDYAKEGVRINVVRPSIVATEQQPLEDLAWLERTKASIPVRRLGEPEDIAKVIAMLLSDEAAFMVGSVVDVTGGR